MSWCLLFGILLDLVGLCQGHQTSFLSGVFPGCMPKKWLRVVQNLLNCSFKPDHLLQRWEGAGHNGLCHLVIFWLFINRKHSEIYKQNAGCECQHATFIWKKDFRYVVMGNTCQLGLSLPKERKKSSSFASVKAPIATSNQPDIWVSMFIVVFAWCEVSGLAL